MSHTKLRPSFTFTDERLAELKRIAPEAFADGRVNWEALRAALGEHLEDDDANAEHFGLNWPGKREARKMAGTPSKGALVPQPGKGVNEDSTRNVFIEGENLEVLKLLQKAYAGKVKMIYIDPPYNTGTDFVYEDDFTEPLEEYLRRTGQVDEEGKALTTNTRADGRFHSKWLSMMYPRLRLARQLLRDDGVIFVSIDDNEVHHLVTLMAEVFGDENKEALVTWRRRHNQPNDKTKMIGKVAEHIVVFARNSEALKTQGGFQGVPLTEKRSAEYKNPDNDPKGPWTSNPWKAAKGRGGSRYTITTPTGKKYTEVWYGNEESFKDLIKEKRVHWTDEGAGVPRIKIYLTEAMEGGQSAINFLRHEEYGSNQDASAELEELYDGVKIFDNPKPTQLLSSLFHVGSKAGDIVLDFFGGSGSTAHACYRMMSEGAGARQFIVVQMHEPVNEKEESGANAKKLGFGTISELTLDRIKRASKSLSKGKKDFDIGVRSYVMTHSHFRAWRDVEGADLTALEKAFAEAESPLVKDWTWEGLCTEVMLLEGFPLDSRVEAVKELKKNRVERIHHEWHAHRLLVCLDKKVAPETIKDLQLEDGDIFICLDTAIDDQSKLRLSDKGMIKTI
ncbi:MAG: DNA methyltransferase [Flavobacteriales bacterium]|nr:MAG: DNA methyltransferase [Flavobacteriales bacterium]